MNNISIEITGKQSSIQESTMFLTVSEGGVLLPLCTQEAKVRLLPPSLPPSFYLLILFLSLALSFCLVVFQSRGSLTLCISYCFGFCLSIYLSLPVSALSGSRLCDSISFFVSLIPSHKRQVIAISSSARYL